MLATSYPSHNYIIIDWEIVHLIQSPESPNLDYFALPMPGFDEKEFPFLALCGMKSISILNVNTHSHKPLISQQFEWYEGLQSMAVIREQEGISIHFAANVIDKEGSGKELIQYCHV